MAWSEQQRAAASTRAARRWREQVATDPKAHPLKRARAARGLTQVSLAKLAFCSPASVSAIERGGSASLYLQDRIVAAIAGSGNRFQIWRELFA